MYLTMFVSVLMLFAIIYRNKKS